MKEKKIYKIFLHVKKKPKIAKKISPSWDKLDITSFNINSIKTDKCVLEEYNRLQKIYNENIRMFFT